MNYLYMFQAERFALSSFNADDDTILHANADNLATVILHIQTRRPARYAKLNAYLNRVFPPIRGVSTKLHGGRAYLRLWSVDPSQEFEDLSIGLEDSGTGLGQALAILSIILTSDFPRVILIDEPNSFLHPSAVRALFDILKEHNHQYIISTHSTEVISLANPSTLHLLRWDGARSTVESLSGSEISDMRRVLTDLGIRLSDVFGADRVLWVEGQTEQVCFKKILDTAGIRQPWGFAIAPVVNTGDFSAKHSRLIWEIYKSLSKSSALLPAAVAFSFDRDGRSEVEITDLRRRSNNLVRFLPRRTYENFLIEPAAIAAVLAVELNRPVEEADVRGWLEQHGGEETYDGYDAWDGDIDGDDWLERVRGAKLLANLFTSFSNATLEYRKPRHSLLLTEWLLLGDPTRLHSLTEYVCELVSGH